jgi:hypothetical protein
MRLASYVPGELIPLPLSGSIPELRHVAKVFLGGRTKFFRAADAFYERRREDHIVSSKIDQGSP